MNRKTELTIDERIDILKKQIAEKEKRMSGLKNNSKGQSRAYIIRAKRQYHRMGEHLLQVRQLLKEMLESNGQVDAAAISDGVPRRLPKRKGRSTR